MLKNPNWNNISDFWAMGETVETTAQELGITVEEVQTVFAYQEKGLEKYFEQQRERENAPEDEEYIEIMNK